MLATYVANEVVSKSKSDHVFFWQRKVIVKAEEVGC